MKINGTVLISESNKGFLTALSLLAQKEFEEVITVSAHEGILNILKEKEVDILILDTGINSAGEQKHHLNLIKEIVSLGREIQIILLTNFSQSNFGLEAVNAGAFDFIAKPWNNEKLLVTLRNAFGMRRLSLEIQDREKQGAGTCTLEEMEKTMMQSALEQQNGNVTLAAAQLGITRQTLYNKGKKYNLFK